MAELWETEFDRHVARLLPAWASVDNGLKARAHMLVNKWAIGDRRDLANAIAEALSDDRFGDREIRSLLARLIKEFGDKEVLGTGVISNLLNRLEQNGSLTTRDIGQVAAAWAANRTRDVNLQDLLEAVTSGSSLNTQTVLNALLNWMRRQGASELAQLLEQQINDPNSDLNSRRLLPLLAGYLVRTGRIKNPGTTITTWEQALTAAFHTLDDSPLVDIIRALQNNDELTAAKIVLKQLGVTSDELVIRAVLTGEVEELVLRELKEEIANRIPNITGEQSAALAQAILDIFSGERTLIAKQEEIDFLKEQLVPIDDGLYNTLWLPTRQILYAAQLACAGGALVPTEAMARPHVFAAASIQATTTLKSLASQNQHALLLDLVRLFVHEEFRDNLKIKTWLAGLPGNRPVTKDELEIGFDMVELYNRFFTVVKG